MRQFLLVGTLLSCVSANVCAQSEADLREYFEGRTVVVKQDLPAGKSAIEIYPDSASPTNYADYGRRIKQLGVAFRRNQSVPLTSLKVNDRSIELQLGSTVAAGADDGSPAASVAVEKSSRERSLERDAERETDPERQAQMQQELDALRKQRQREDARLKAALAQLSNGSDDRQRTANAVARIDLVFNGGVPARALNPDYVKSALKNWLDFNAAERPAPPPPPPIVSSDDNASPYGLRKGMTEAELVRLFGEPAKRESSTQGDLHVDVLTFKRDGTTLEATMVESILVRFRQWSD
ncbi:MAG TPA: hypothetical protein VNX88_20855 [Terriglobales bacterium]|jgi:hypothetical protein|nr:hypothetical protein [Terriglobales bacterium]